ncbi:MAG: oxygen-independent coproporphyrinogen III oxidase [Bradyrhizobium sp.]|nr:oxygen-independent coproporphyrinogen III oxidase [Bradyrhizobium sp.]
MTSSLQNDGALALAERTVPRYTSYPTAPQFSASVGPDTYAGWLDALPRDARLSLYIHVPFCTELCFYCGCNTRAVRKRAPVDAYAERLLDEIALLGSLRGLKLTHLHWGGGTPSILGPQWLETIAGRLASVFNLSDLKEHAIELDPRRLDRPMVRTLRAIGVNRASLGVQDASPQVQRAIGRVQPFEMVERAAFWLREAGIANLNVDLMYGLPTQTARDVARSAELAAGLGAQRLALFGYAHVPWFKANQKQIDEAALPDSAARLEQAKVAEDTLLSFGYRAIGLDHFALPSDDLAVAAREKRLHRNFQGYTTDTADALVAFGASAISEFPQGFAQAARDTLAWTQTIAGRRSPVVRGLATTAEDRMRGAIIEQIMCNFSADIGAIASRHGFNSGMLEDSLLRLQPLIAAGLASIEGSTVRVPQEHRLFLRSVACAFDGHYTGAKNRHARAI